MRDEFQTVSDAMDLLLRAAREAKLIPPGKEAEVLHQEAFWGVSYATIYRHLATTFTEVLVNLGEPCAYPQIQGMKEDVVHAINVLLGIMAEGGSYLTVMDSGRVSDLLCQEDNTWQQVFRAVAEKLIWIVLEEDADGSV